MKKLYGIGNEGSYAVISSRGASILSWTVGRTAIIFPQTTKNGFVEGGIQICFPFWGLYQRFSGEIPQHGWLKGQDLVLDEQGENLLALKGYMQTKKTYPWYTLYEVKISVTERELRLSFHVLRLNDGVDGLAPINPSVQFSFSCLGQNKVVIDGTEIRRVFPIGKEIIIDMGAKKVKISLGGDFDVNSQLILGINNTKESFCVSPVLTHPGNFDKAIHGKFLRPRQELNLSYSLSVL
jgi:hypothetical protein